MLLQEYFHSSFNIYVDISVTYCYHPQLIVFTATIIKKAEVPRILIGLMGYTGSGKSSLLNALIDEEMIVACNAMRASTSVVVEISWNKSDDPAEAYAAEIQFVKPEEWTNEFEILADDIRNRPEGEQLGARSGSEAGIAYAKISAVYPGSNVTELLGMSAEQLLEERHLSTFLDKERYIKEATAKKFYKAIKVYIDSSNKGSTTQPAYWPLVRCVKIFPKAHLLENGLVLVDLPGLGDSNAGRAKIAERYMNNLDHAWIVADIIRAVDDQVAKDLMGKSFRRRLLMDDKYDDSFVALVTTKTDQVNIHEVIDSLNLDELALRDHLAEETRLREDLEECEEQMQKIKGKHNENQRQLKKLAAEEKQIRSRARESPPTGQKRTFDETSMSQSESVSKQFSKRDSTRLEEIAQERKKLKASQKEGAKAEKALEAEVAKTKNEQSSLMTSMRTIYIDKRNQYT
jgi:GTP-binding protein EngB required for normal cell division